MQVKYYMFLSCDILLVFFGVFFVFFFLTSTKIQRNFLIEGNSDFSLKVLVHIQQPGKILLLL